MEHLEPGEIAPDFSARDADGREVSLASKRGRFVLVYFYPKDDTPGCTAEACSLNDSLEDLSESGADVIGVSTQDDASHARFRRSYGLRFALAADVDREIAGAYGVGRSMGILPLSARQSFLVAPDGVIAEVWPHVNPQTHAAEVLAAVRRNAKALKGKPLKKRRQAPTGRPRS